MTLEYWIGEGIENKHDLMENIFWNEADDEIGFNTSDSAGDYNLSELPDIEQFNVCLAIIDASEH